MASLTTTRNEYIKWAICVVLGILCLLIPESEIFTINVKLFLMITVLGLSITAFELLPTIVVSVLMPVLWILLKVAPMETVLSSWVGTLPLMIVGAFFMAASLEQCGLLRRIAFFLLCKVHGSYLTLLCSIFVISVFINIITSGRSYLIMAPLVFGLCVSLDGMNKKLGAGLAAATMVGSCTSHMYTYQASALGIVIQAGKEYIGPTDITPLSIILHNCPMFFISFVLIFIAAKMFTPEEGLGEISWFEDQLKKMGKITREEKVNAFMLILLLIYVFTVDIHGLDVNLGFASIPWIVYLPFLKGADEKTIKKIDFSMVFFIIACMSIGTVASSLGFGDAIANGMKAVLHGSTNPMVIVALIFLMVFVLNFLMTPAAILALIIGPVLSMVVEMGFNPIGFTYAVNACTEAILLPYEYVPYLVVFSFGMMKMKDFLKFNVIRSLVVFLGLVLIQVPYWSLFGLI